MVCFQAVVDCSPPSFSVVIKRLSGYRVLPLRRILRYGALLSWLQHYQLRVLAGVPCTRTALFLSGMWTLWNRIVTGTANNDIML